MRDKQLTFKLCRQEYTYLQKYFPRLILYLYLLVLFLEINIAFDSLLGLRDHFSE